MLVAVGDRARVREDGSFDVLERDPQEGRDAHDLVERRSADAAELPAFDRAGADADDLAEPRARVAGRLAALLKQSGEAVLLKGHGFALPTVDQRLCPSYSSDLLTRRDYRA